MEPPTVWLKVECPPGSTSEPAFRFAPTRTTAGFGARGTEVGHEACRASADPSNRSELSWAWRLKQSFSLNRWCGERRKVLGVDTDKAPPRAPLPVRRKTGWRHTGVM